MNAAASHADLTVAAWPGLTPRLVIDADTTESLADYRSAGGFQELTDPESLLAQVDRAGLVGRGGAAFPMSIKLRSVRDARLRGRDTVIVANGEEGEPASIKDRWLLHHRPHLVLDGLRLAARVIGAAHAHVYISDAGAARSIEAALVEIGGPDGLSPACLARAQDSWSLSQLTLPHPLVRIVLAEQLYRAWSIRKGHPYHRA